ncbi:hypothetical protein JHK86_031988 [Glycine max]|nr:hypothetical protein JHK86_031988 [Glycine max]
MAAASSAAGQVREWVPLMAAAGRVRHSWCRQQWLRDGEKCPALGDGGTALSEKLKL